MLGDPSQKRGDDLNLVDGHRLAHTFSDQSVPLDVLQKICEEIQGIVIPYRIHQQLSDEAYLQLEQLMIAKMGWFGVPAPDDSEDRWGDQREED